MGIKTVYEDCDILVVGGGMGGTGAAYESRYWGRDLKIVIAEKANIDRSGAVAQGLSPLTATWELNGVRTIPRIMCAMPVMT